MSTPESLLDAGARYQWPQGDVVELDVVRIARVDLPSGALAIVDPSAAPWELAALSPAWSPGLGPVEILVTLARSVVEDGEAPNGAAAMARVEGSRPVSWRPAEVAGRPVKLAVDAGMGAFLDPVHVDRLIAIQDDPERDTVLVQETIAVGFHVDWLDRESTAIVAFDCGVGDGVYDCWYGLDEEGALVALLCDLELLDHLAPLSE